MPYRNAPKDETPHDIIVELLSDDKNKQYESRFTVKEIAQAMADYPTLMFLCTSQYQDSSGNKKQWAFPARNVKAIQSWVNDRRRYKSELMPILDLIFPAVMK